MAGKRETGVAWRHTTVLLRADIFARAKEQGIDISNACNRTLADLLGIDYRQQLLDTVPVPTPVIVAKDGGVPVQTRAAPASRSSLPPVINADDPAAVGVITTIKKQPAKKPASGNSSDTLPAPKEKFVLPPGKVTKDALPKKIRRTPARKTGTGDGLKKFLAAMVVREDTEEALIPKDDFYQIFSRWCRAQKIGTVPEAKNVTIALKTQFAFREKTVNSKSCWVNVRFR